MKDEAKSLDMIGKRQSAHRRFPGWKEVDRVSRVEDDELTRYSLTLDDLTIGYELTQSVADGVCFWGVTVRMRSGGGVEQAELSELATDRALALDILRAMRRGAVTPCAARGVAEDLLAEATLRRAQRK